MPKDISLLFLRWSEEALRDISEMIEHGGTPDNVNKKVKLILFVYWKSKSLKLREMGEEKAQKFRDMLKNA